MTDKPSYKDSLFLPKTDFPMVADPGTTEPKILADWEKGVSFLVYRPGSFVIHDGPPYANGNIHMGHALNKVLKDFVVRSQMAMGNKVTMYPGWDCHGLPIEWKVEEQLREEGLDPTNLSIKFFRQRCRQYAEKWVGIQREQFKRLGVQAKWEDPYLTMDYQIERDTLAELFKFAGKGSLYRGSKPVMWSPVEQTSLAEAEVEYKEITSTQVDVAFPVVETNIPELVGASLVIWTTTPWSLPVNQALAVNRDLDYEAIKTDKGVFVVATKCRELSLARWGLSNLQTLWKGKGLMLDATKVKHPILDGDRPVLMADFVSIDSGTGVVHIAPDHGVDDFDLGRDHGLKPLNVVQADGRYREDWPWLGGQGSVINNSFNSPEGPVCSDLYAAGVLLAASKDYRHSYPHSWRSKAKVFYRTTPQWFIGVIEGGSHSIKSKALEALDETTWIPDRSYNRIRSMVEDRPDWLISRQRRWGVPIALYVNKQTGEYLYDPEVNNAILRAVAQDGADVWWDHRHEEFLAAGGHKLEDFEVVEDILDVWFDSGTSYSYVLDHRHAVDKADLYLEGSDQHRGWFQASLLASCGTRGFAPYKTVLTHGFVLDKKGKKMAKSEGNVVDPLEVVDKYGADTLRLWVALTNYQDDVRISDDALKGANDTYRKIRNTFRYMVSVCQSYSGKTSLKYALKANMIMNPLDSYIINRIVQIEQEVRLAAGAYDFTSYANILIKFMNEELSSFYFDVMKDVLYCEQGSNEWLVYQALMLRILTAMLSLWQPLLPFLCQECWNIVAASFQGVPSPVSSMTMPVLQGYLVETARTVMDDWKKFFQLRDLVNKEVELAIKAGSLKSSFEARVSVSYPVDFDLGFKDKLSGYLKVAEVHEDSSVVSKLAVTVTNAGYDKCERCRLYYPEVDETSHVCSRCSEYVE